MEIRPVSVARALVGPLYMLNLKPWLGILSDAAGRIVLLVDWVPLMQGWCRERPSKI